MEPPVRSVVRSVGTLRLLSSLTIATLTSCSALEKLSDVGNGLLPYETYAEVSHSLDTYDLDNGDYYYMTVGFRWQLRALEVKNASDQSDRPADPVHQP